MKGKLIVLSGPSGVGKGTLCSRLDWEGLDLHKSISMTTRKMRPEDREGVTYYFVTEDEFKKNIEEGNFLEYAQFNNCYYGTPRKAVQKWIEQGHNVLLEIETRGAAQIMENYPEAVSIFLMPPEKDALKERLHHRGSETEEEIQKRLSEANRELKLAENYKFTVVNDVLDQAVRQVTDIICQETGCTDPKEC